jgi:hypothetical protein
MEWRVRAAVVRFCVDFRNDRDIGMVVGLENMLIRTSEPLEGLLTEAP